MMQIKQTIPLYSFYKWDDTLFDLLEVPEGIDKDKLVDWQHHLQSVSSSSTSLRYSALLASTQA